MDFDGTQFNSRRSDVVATGNMDGYPAALNDARFASQAQDGRIIILGDGRQLGFAEWGAADGKAIFYFHGYPGSRLEAALVDETARRLGARVICLERPGMGLSSFKEGRRLLDWPDDVLEAAEVLGIEEFAVLGMSGGGPYAAACAYKIPERLTACGIVAGLAPLQYGGREMSWPIRLVFWLAEHAPGWYESILGMTLKVYRRNPERLQQVVADWLYGLPEPDQRYMARPEVRAAIVSFMEEGFRQGARGPAYEGQLYTMPWDFELEEIWFERMALWHGELDGSVPLAMGQAMARRIPRVRATFYPYDGHLSIALNHMEEIVTWVLGTGAASRRRRPGR